jgi:hypothetical protein
MGHDKMTNICLGEHLERRIAEGLKFFRERNPGANWNEEDLIRYAVSYGLNHLIRQYVRKNTNLPGEYGKLFPDAAGEKIIVEDLSQGGIKFRTIEENYIKANEILEVEFVLDDETRTVVSKRVIIRHVYDRLVGAEFCEPEYDDTRLGAYLMSRHYGEDEMIKNNSKLAETTEKSH